MKAKILLLVFCVLGILMPAEAQQTQTQEEEAISMVTQIYKDVSGANEQAVDWEKVRSVFLDEAIIVLRTSAEGSSQFTVDEFIQDFLTFYRSPRLGDSGFKEEVLQLESESFHDMAFVAVVYESSIIDSGRPPQKGIDFWLLTRKQDAWKVVSVTNEIVRPGGKLPGIFSKQAS